eukprot:UN22627
MMDIETMIKKNSTKIDAVVNQVRGKFTEIVGQVKQKFADQKEWKIDTEEKLESLGKKIKKVKNRMSNNEDERSLSSENLNLTVEDRIEQMKKDFAMRENKLHELIKHLTREVGELKTAIRKTNLKLVRWKTRNDFSNEGLYIEYVCGMLDKYRQQKPTQYQVYVRVVNPVGKSKHFGGLIGEIKKYNTQLCWVKWTNLNNLPVDTYDWNT